LFILPSGWRSFSFATLFIKLGDCLPEFGKELPRYFIMARFLRWIFILAVIGAAVTYGALRGKAGNAEARPELTTVPLKMGGLVSTINVSGTIEPEDLINVGSQVGGRIMDFGRDKQGKTIDYGSNVEEGMVLAHIDDVVYRSELAEAEAQVSGAKADLEYAKVSLKQYQAKYDQAQRDWTRAQRLGVSQGLSQAQYDNYRSAYEIAEANLQMGRVAIQQAQAKLEQTKAALDRAQKNLGYCTIQSPVKGVIIDRRVNVGQTVAASLSAPSLFLLAKDLTRVQIWVAVNEADIGSIKPGQPVTFTVDAFPNETFQGKVNKIRLNATMTNNVVTYTVEVTTDNPKGRLLPYLTANVNFETDRRENALIAPITALKWAPSADVRAAYGLAPTSEAEDASGRPVRESKTERAGGTDKAAKTDRAAGAPRAEKAERTGKAAGADPAAAHAEPPQAEVWTLEGETLKSIPVKVGISDGMDTEVSGEGLKPGMQLVTGVQESTVAARQAGRNPFLPKMPMRRNGKAGGPPI
jgi:HlyD family secretion protein